MIYAFMLALLFAHFFIPSIEWAWKFGWAARLFVIAVFSVMLWLDIKPRNHIERSILLLTAFYSTLGILSVVFNLYIDETIVLWAVVAMSALFWVVKQFLLLQVKSDPLSYTTYCYGLAPIRNRWGMLNILRPSVFGTYGGRLIVAGDHTYLIHRGQFKKVPTRSIKLSNYILVDTDKPLCKETDKMLDRKIGKRAIPLFNDCATLDCGVSLTKLLWLKS